MIQHRAPPRRPRLAEVNAHLTCVLCRGYLIDATTIVECLHSFCRSCIIQHLQMKSYCPVCEMMINSAKPNIKPDKALQDIVYKLVPELFQREMRRRRVFYASHGSAAAATPEGRGEDTERLIFSPSDHISLSLEYSESTDPDNTSSRSSDSGADAPSNLTDSTSRMPKRFLQCPAVFRISHIKKFLINKYEIDSNIFHVDVLYKRVPLPDHYTLMDIAYIYMWKRNEPMRFFYRVYHVSMVCDRFDFFEPIFEASSVAQKASPVQQDIAKKILASPERNTAQADKAVVVLYNVSREVKSVESVKVEPDSVKSKNETPKGVVDSATHALEVDTNDSDSDIEKSQFLNSFELTAKKSLSPVKSEKLDDPPTVKKSTSPPANALVSVKSEFAKGTPKVKSQPSGAAKRKAPKADTKAVKKKRKIEPNSPKQVRFTVDKPTGAVQPTKYNMNTKKCVNPTPSMSQQTINPKIGGQPPIRLSVKLPAKLPILAPALKLPNKDTTIVQKSKAKQINGAKNNTNYVGNTLKIKPVIQSKQIPVPNGTKVVQTPKTSQKRKITNGGLPYVADGKPFTKQISMPQLSPNFLGQEQKLLSESKPCTQRPGPARTKNSSPLQSLFDSCNINIPSSLSITLTDSPREEFLTHAQPRPEASNGMRKMQKLGGMTLTEIRNDANPKYMPNDCNPKHTSPVNNYIEILKLPDKSLPDVKQVPVDTPSGGKTISPKGLGPVPNLKPIEPKTSKTVPSAVPTALPSASTIGGTGVVIKPQTFQQTFLQSLQQQCENPKFSKPKSQCKSDAGNPTQSPAPALLPLSQHESNTKVEAKSTDVEKPVTKCDNKIEEPRAINGKSLKAEGALDLSTPSNTTGKRTILSIAQNLSKKQTEVPALTPNPVTYFPAPNKLRIPATASKHPRPSSLGSSSPSPSPPCENPRRSPMGSQSPVSPRLVIASPKTSPKMSPNSKTPTPNQSNLISSSNTTCPVPRPPPSGKPQEGSSRNQSTSLPRPRANSPVVRGSPIPGPGSLAGISPAQMGALAAMAMSPTPAHVSAMAQQAFIYQHLKMRQSHMELLASQGGLGSPAMAHLMKSHLQPGNKNLHQHQAMHPPIHTPTKK